MELELKFTVEQVNKILSALGNQPYLEVHELINTIHAQANEQLNSQDALNGGGQNASEE